MPITDGRNFTHADMVTMPVGRECASDLISARFFLVIFIPLVEQLMASAMSCSSGFGLYLGLAPQHHMAPISNGAQSLRSTIGAMDMVMHFVERITSAPINKAPKQYVGHQYGARLPPSD